MTPLDQPGQLADPDIPTPIFAQLAEAYRPPADHLPIGPVIEAQLVEGDLIEAEHTRRPIGVQVTETVIVERTVELIYA